MSIPLQPTSSHDSPESLRNDSDRSIPIDAMLVAGIVVLLPFLSRNVVASRFVVLPVAAMSLGALLIPYGLAKLGSAISRRDRDPALWIAVALPVLMTISAAVHRLPAALFTISFAFGAAMITLVIRDMDRDTIRRYVAYPLLATASIQALLAMTQLATGKPIVPDWLAANIEVLVIDGVARPQGTMYHVYHLAALGLLAIAVWIAVRKPGPRIHSVIVVALALSAAMVTITFSRSALLGLVAIVGALIVGGLRGDRSSFAIAAVLVAAGVVAVALTASGWTTRVEQSAVSNLDEASLGRVTLTEQAFTLIAAEPLFGVGPGRFIPEIEDRGLTDEEHPFIVHSYVLALTAENGVLAGLIVLTLLVWLGFAAVRSGPDTGAAYFALVPLLVFDVLHYVYPSPQLMFGVWLGVLSAAIGWSNTGRAQISRRTRSS